VTSAILETSYMYKAIFGKVFDRRIARNRDVQDYQASLTEKTLHSPHGVQRRKLRDSISSTT
jgi:hypothetical protein